MREEEVHRPGVPRGIGGWLLLLCVLLIVWGPIELSLVASKALEALPVRGPSLGVLLGVRVAIVAFGIAAGLSLSSRQPVALTLVRVSLVATAAVDTFVYLTPYFPSNIMPGDEWLYVAGTIAYAVAWLLYLARSRRVRHTFD